LLNSGGGGGTNDAESHPATIRMAARPEAAPLIHLVRGPWFAVRGPWFVVRILIVRTSVVFR
jgi:hypothetical protein